jgi:(p)ppGpp synthase/HD superfamily hydrolase
MKESMKEMQCALIFASNCHEDQCRKDGFTPYIVHPIEVMVTVRNWGVNDIDVLMACLCHDILEECEKGEDGNPDSDILRWAREEMIDSIGDKASSFVEELTFIPDRSSSLKINEQKAEYLRSFKTKSVESLLIKCADRICNTNDFLREQTGYALKYWRKANELFDIFVSRKQEILEKFGEKTLAAVVLAVGKISHGFIP